MGQWVGGSVGGCVAREVGGLGVIILLIELQKNAFSVFVSNVCSHIQDLQELMSLSEDSHAVV